MANPQTNPQTKALSEKTASAIQSGDNLLAYRNGAIERVTQSSFKSKNSDYADALKFETSTELNTVGDIKNRLIEFYGSRSEKFAALNIRASLKCFENWNNDEYVNEKNNTFHIIPLSPYSSSRFQLLVCNAPNIGVYMLAYNNGTWSVQLKPSSASTADMMSCPLENYEGSTVQDFITWLTEITTNRKNNGLVQFQTSLNYDHFENFSDRAAAFDKTNTSALVRCTFTKIAAYTGSDLYWKWMVASASKANIYYITRNGNNYFCYRVAPTKV